MKKILVCILFILSLLSVECKAQKVAVKSNLLYDATTTMNLGLEVALARKWTLDIPVNYNPWKFDLFNTSRRCIVSFFLELVIKMQ